MNVTQIVARYLHEMSTYPERPERLYEELSSTEKAAYRRKAELLSDWLGMHNYYYLHFPQGGLFGNKT